jgi:ferredoxin/flavodoxin---NADP+ reductase
LPQLHLKLQAGCDFPQILIRRGVATLDVLAMIAPDERFYRARVTQRIDFAPGLWAFRIQPGEHFNFIPGQFATLGLVVEGKRIERPYSMVSSPSENELEFFLELVPEGKLTPALYQLQPGDEMLMRKIPKGKFTLQTGDTRINHLLVSTVTGVAPFVSMIRNLAKEWREGCFDGAHRLFLLNGASRPSEFGYKDELTHLAEEMPWLQYVPTVSRAWEYTDWTGEIGRADDILRKYADQWGLEPHNTHAYLCGHPGMIENTKAILKRRGFIDKGAIKEETYWLLPRHERAEAA